jgi:hypothetical protein
LFTGMSVPGRHTSGWPADHGHVCGMRLEGCIVKAPGPVAEG